LGLYKRPIYIWHHTAIVKSSKKINEIISRFFYKGIDRLYFFSEELKTRSIQSKKTNPNKFKVINWGPDLEFYNTKYIDNKEIKFVSTGREHRDYITLLKAVSKTNLKCEILAPKGEIEHDEEDINEVLKNIPTNIIYREVSLPIEEITKIAAESFVIMVCCQQYEYTIGLTSIAEAMGYGKPVIVTKNQTFPFNIEEEGFGLEVLLNDIDGWMKAIEYMSENPEETRKMGKKGRLLAEKKFNLNAFGKEIANDLLEYKNFIHK
jgi:glycosyltransferase involved in cell wall biosynthesis